MSLRGGGRLSDESVGRSAPEGPYVLRLLRVEVDGWTPKRERISEGVRPVFGGGEFRCCTSVKRG